MRISPFLLGSFVTLMSCSYGTMNGGEYSRRIKGHAKQSPEVKADAKAILASDNNKITNDVAACLHYTLEAESLEKAIASGYSVIVQDETPQDLLEQSARVCLGACRRRADSKDTPETLRSIAKKYGARCESRFSPEAKLKQKVARLTGLAETSIAEAERHLDEEDPLAARRALLNANRLLSKATAVSPKAQVAALRARITAVREAHRTELARAETFEADPRVLELRRQLQRIADAHLIAERNHSRLADKRLSGCDPNLADCDDHRAENAYANEVERLDEDYAAAKANLDQLREQLGL